MRVVGVELRSVPYKAYAPFSVFVHWHRRASWRISIGLVVASAFLSFVLLDRLRANGWPSWAALRLIFVLFVGPAVAMRDIADVEENIVICVIRTPY